MPKVPGMAQERYFEEAYALLIGVGNEDIPQSAQDAEGLGHVLTNPEKSAYNPAKVKVLTAEQTTREGVLSGLNRLIDVLNPKKEQTVIVFYSGHGGLFTTREGERKYFLCNHGFDEARPEETGISADEFSLLIQSIPSHRKLVMLDCCHAAGMLLESGDLVKPKFLGTFFSNSTYRGLVEKLSMGEGMVSLVSCDQDEKSVIFQRSQYSLFTEKVIEALEGYGSGQDDYVAVIDLINYVLKSVPRAYKRQNPKLKSAHNLNALFSLCRNSRPVGLASVPDRVSGGFKALVDEHELRLPTAEPNVDYVLSIKGQIQEAVKGNRFDRAFRLLDGLLLIMESKILRDTVVLLNQNYRSLQDDQMLGVITKDKYTVELSKIALRMLNCADRLEEFYEDGF